MSSRLANRALTDQLIEELLEAHEAGRWEYEAEVRDRLGWTQTRWTRTVTYLQHRYLLFVRLPASEALRLTAPGLERYLAGEILPCACSCCAGERER